MRASWPGAGCPATGSKRGTTPPAPSLQRLPRPPAPPPPPQPPAARAAPSVGSIPPRSERARAFAERDDAQVKGVGAAVRAQGAAVDEVRVAPGGAEEGDDGDDENDGEERESATHRADLTATAAAARLLHAQHEAVAHVTRIENEEDADDVETRRQVCGEGNFTRVSRRPKVGRGADGSEAPSLLAAIELHRLAPGRRGGDLRLVE